MMSDFVLSHPSGRQRSQQIRNLWSWICISKERFLLILRACSFQCKYSNLFTDRPGLLLPLQEQGLLHQGGMPVFGHCGTVWSYEPSTAKITFMYFPKSEYELLT